MKDLLMLSPYRNSKGNGAVPDPPPSDVPNPPAAIAGETYEYKTLSNGKYENKDEFDKQLNTHIGKGWEIVGGLCTSSVKRSDALSGESLSIL